MATPPLPSDAAAQLAHGLRLEKAGVLDRALDAYRIAAAAEDANLAAQGHCRQAVVHRTRCEWDDALAAARESARLATTAGLNERLAEALNAEAAVHQSRGAFALAIPILERISSVTTSERMRGVALQNLGAIAAQSGDLATAEQRFAASLAAFERIGYRWGAASALLNLGRLTFERGDLARARVLFEDADGAAREVEDLDLHALVMLNRAELAMAESELASAVDLASTALGHFGSEGNSWRRLECLRLLGDIAHREGSAATAARCYEQGIELAQRIGAAVEETTLRERLAAVGGASDRAPV